MKVFSHLEMLDAYCRATKQWALYIGGFDYPDLPLVNVGGVHLEAAPYLDPNTNLPDRHDLQVMMAGCGFVICDSEEEAFSLFDQTVGDDGPTLRNQYDGPHTVYAVLAGPDGWVTENT